MGKWITALNLNLPSSCALQYPVGGPPIKLCAVVVAWVTIPTNSTKQSTQGIITAHGTSLLAWRWFAYLSKDSTLFKNGLSDLSRDSELARELSSIAKTAPRTEYSGKTSKETLFLAQDSEAHWHQKCVWSMMHSSEFVSQLCQLWVCLPESQGWSVVRVYTVSWWCDTVAPTCA